MNPIEFAVLFLGIWGGVTGSLALLGGWFGLSRFYRDRNPPKNLEFIGQSAQVGFVNYGRCINAHIAEDGLHLRSHFLFRLMQPPLFIPWSEITSVTAKKWLFFINYRVVIKQTGTKICFYGELGQAIQKEWQDKSPPVACGNPGNK